MLVLSRSIPDFYTRKDVSVEENVGETFLRGMSMEEAALLLRGTGANLGDEEFQEAYSVSAGHPILLQMAAISGGDIKEMKARVTTYLMEEFYLKMDGEERAVLARLSAFRKPIPSEAFLRTEEDVEALRRLLRAGMVHYNQKGEYFVHDIIRALFMTRRNLTEEHRAAAEYYRELGEKEDKVEVINHLIKAGDYALAEKEIRSNIATILSYGQARTLLEAMETAPQTPVFLSARARAIANSEKASAALEIAEKAVSISGEDSMYFSLLNLGAIRSRYGDYTGSEIAFRDALQHANTEYERMTAQRFLAGMALGFQHRYAEAEALERESMEYFKNAGLLDEEAMTKTELSVSLARQGHLKESLALLRDAAEYFERERMYRNLGVVYSRMAMYEAYLGNREGARRYFEVAALYGEMTGNMKLIGISLMNSADNYIFLGNPEKAESYAARARKILMDVGSAEDVAIALSTLFKAHLMMGAASADEEFETVETELIKGGDMSVLAEFYCETADIERRAEKKRNLYEKAMKIYEELGDEQKQQEIRGMLEAHEEKEHTDKGV